MQKLRKRLTLTSLLAVRK